MKCLCENEAIALQLFDKSVPITSSIEWGGQVIIGPDWFGRTIMEYGIVDVVEQDPDGLNDIDELTGPFLFTLAALYIDDTVWTEFTDYCC